MAEFMKWKLTESGLTKFNPIDGMRSILTHLHVLQSKYFNIKVLPELIKTKKKKNKSFPSITQSITIGYKLQIFLTK